MSPCASLEAIRPSTGELRGARASCSDLVHPSMGLPRAPRASSHSDASGGLHRGPGAIGRYWLERHPEGLARSVAMPPAPRSTGRAWVLGPRVARGVRPGPGSPAFLVKGSARCSWEVPVDPCPRRDGIHGCEDCTSTWSPGTVTVHRAEFLRRFACGAHDSRGHTYVRARVARSPNSLLTACTRRALRTVRLPNACSGLSASRGTSSCGRLAPVRAGPVPGGDRSLAHSKPGMSGPQCISARVRRAEEVAAPRA